MKLLILTQKVDKEDPILGFFHGWIIELSKRFEDISVICLEKGKFDLPKNVKVFSLGKEFGGSKIKYVKNFFSLILGLREEYNSVFVHMNQEYVLLGGFFWRIMHKKIFLWRNHPNGNFLTRIAILLSNKVFYTSKFAFVAKYKKTEIMPVGIDTSIFNTELRIKNYELCKRKILFLGRMSPIKKPDLLIEALDILNKRETNFLCDFYGDPLLKDRPYYNSLKKRVGKLKLEERVNFYPAVPNYKTPEIYREHEIFVNLTPSGSFDKTILEAAACGCLPVVANHSLSGEVDGRLIMGRLEPEKIAEKIEFWLSAKEDEKIVILEKLQNYVLKNHSLDALMDEICSEIS